MLTSHFCLSCHRIHLHFFNIFFSYHLLERQSHVQCYIIEKSFCRCNNISDLEILIIQHIVEEEGNEQ